MDTTAGSAITLTDAARTALAHIFGNGPRPDLRVFLSFLHESGPRLDLAPDTLSASDTVCTAGGWRIGISALLLEQAAPVTIDCRPDGFIIDSRLDFSEAGGNCGGACGDHH